MATSEASPDIDAHDGHDHDRPPWLAHHFDTPEQQFDSGKLGIWLFLVTEVLFFSGMFCAYAIFRMMRPDVFEGCSQFLNTKLGAINTGVLLFSSLTMAWAVRCAQTENHKGLTALLASTLSCAMVFLGVKAIEYSHKWGMGLLPAGYFTYDPSNPHPADVPNYLAYICAPFAIALVGVVIWLVISIIREDKFQVAVAKPMTVVCLSFFAGVFLGNVLESGGSEGHSETHFTVVDDGHGDDGHDEHGDGQSADGVAHEANADPAATGDGDASHGELDGELNVQSVQEMLAFDSLNKGIQDKLEANRRQSAISGGSVVHREDQISGAISSVPDNVLTPSKAGVFFSIYYCMTGVHAIHILGGIAVLIWLLVRSVRQDFNRHYFGPVDYVGLYWHLVDLIWIYLFPLMYLIR